MCHCLSQCVYIANILKLGFYVKQLQSNQNMPSVHPTCSQEMD